MSARERVCVCENMHMQDENVTDTESWVEILTERDTDRSSDEYKRKPLIDNYRERKIEGEKAADIVTQGYTNTHTHAQREKERERDNTERDEETETEGERERERETKV
jgi:hypothetical protein